MTRRLTASLAAALILSTLNPVLGHAAGDQLFERVKGWEIERTANGADNHPCLLSKSWKDKADNNAENAIVVAFMDDAVAISLGYEHWTWDKDESVTVPLLIDDKVVNPKSSWVGDGTILATKLPGAMMARLVPAKKIVLRFKNGNAGFELAGLPEAMESVKRCEASAVAAPKAAAAPPPTMPSDGHIKAYAFGLMTQDVIKECDVKTTGVQRTAVDAKVAMLKPEMTLVDASLRESLKGRPERCPPNAAASATFEENLQAFIAQPLEEFIAMMDRKEAEKKAAAAKL